MASGALTNRLRIFALVATCGLVACSGQNGTTDSGADAAGDLAQADLGADRGSPDRGPDTRPHTLPANTTLQGIVVSAEDGAPIAGALVQIGGRLERVTSDAQGRFTLPLKTALETLETALTAGHPDFFSGGVEVVDASAEQRLALKPHARTDDPSYAFKSPDAIDGTPHCVHCHRNQVQPWSASAHAGAAQNPKLFDLYNGTASGFRDAASCLAAGGAWLDGRAPGDSQAKATKKCYLLNHPGVLKDLNPGVCGAAGQPSCDDPAAPSAAKPTAFGPCADCHAAASAVAAPGKTNLNTLHGLTYDKGIHCDFCHKIDAVKANGSPGINGAIVLRRPGPADASGWSDPEVMYGPLPDVTLSVMGNVYRPQFKESSFCSGCHQWTPKGIRPGDASMISASKWPEGLPVQDTFAEWLESDAAKSKGWSCQSCHMPPIAADSAAFDLKGLSPLPSGVLGWFRSPGQVRSHAFRARLAEATAGDLALPGEPPRTLLRDPIAITLTPSRSASALDVEVTLENKGAGHSIPTGTPSRQLLLVVEALVGGSALPASGGHSIPGWTGARLEVNVGPQGANLSGTTVTLPSGQSWPAGAVGKRLRAVAAAATSPWADYPATRWFGASGRTPADKGMRIQAPLGEATITAVSGKVATLDAPLVAPAGSTLLLGDSVPRGPGGAALAVDETRPGGALAGASGWVFGKRLIDREGESPAPFHRAVDMVSDNRIPAGAAVKTAHRFDVSAAAGKSVELRVTLLYRRTPFDRATRRGWSAVDAVRAVKTLVVAPSQ